MSKIAKTKAKMARLNQKRARKAATCQTYATWAEEGRNRKTKRSRKGQRVVRARQHEIYPCGNLACAKCYEWISNPWMAKLGTSLYSKRFTSPKWKVR